MTADHNTAAALTEAEKDALRETWDFGPFGTEAHQFAAVERILAARLAAQPPQDDPQPDEREALAEAWDSGAQAVTDWIKSGAWLATMPENPHHAALAEPTPGSKS